MTTPKTFDPDVLEVLSQPDFLSLSASAAQDDAFGMTRDGIGLMGEAAVFDNQTAYAPLIHFGRTSGGFTAHCIILGRNFLVRHLMSPDEWTAVFEDFATAAHQALSRLASQIRAQADRCPRTHKHYLRFAYVTNLVPTGSTPPLDLEAKRREVKTRLEAVTTPLLAGINLASQANRVHALLLNHRGVALLVDADLVRDALSRYKRYVIEATGNGRLTVTAALLGGVHALAAETDANQRSLSKISFLKSDYHRVNEDVIAELQALVDSRATREADLQRFFEANPYLLCDGQQYHVYPQITFETDAGRTLRPDFFLELMEPSALSPHALIDIKLPSERLILQKKNRPRFYSKIYEYAAQLREYSRFLDSPTQRRRLLERFGIRALRPRLVMIIGRDYEQADYELVDRIKDSIRPVELRTYDDIIRFGRGLCDVQRASSRSA